MDAMAGWLTAGRLCKPGGMVWGGMHCFGVRYLLNRNLVKAGKTAHGRGVLPSRGMAAARRRPGR